jgi:hypothetical protein
MDEIDPIGWMTHEPLAKKYAWARDFLLTGGDSNRQNAGHHNSI